MKYPKMFETMQIGKVTVKNRVVMGALGHGQAADQCEFSKSTEDFYALRAKGGVGMIITGITEPDFEIDHFPNDGVAGYVNPNYNPKVFIERGTELTERVHTYGAKIFCQVTAGFGRALHDNSCSENPLWADPSTKAHALTVEEIHRKEALVASAAAVAKQAGFDGVDLSALHEGCLMDEFATPFFNHRTDGYGGTFENRMRFTRELVEGIQEACGKDFPITIRMSAVGFMKGWNQASLDGTGEVGRTLEDSIEIAKYLEKIGVAAILVDAGTMDSMYHMYQPMYIPMGSNFIYTKEIRKHVSIPVICTGRLDEPKLIEENLEAEMADGVCISRQFLADPDFVKKAELGMDEAIRPCLSCNVGCLHRVFSGQRYSCAVNPVANRETTYGLTPALEKKHVLIIGGGVAGMEAARVLMLRGHHVEIWEKSDKLGGHLLSGGAPDFKQDELLLVKWYEREMARLKVPIVYHKEAAAEDVLAYGADVVINAAGSSAIIPGYVKGAEYAITGEDALLGTKPVGQKVVIVGGGLVGCELAWHLYQQKKDVTIIEMMPKILVNGKTVPIMNRMCLEDLINASDIKVMTSCRLVAAEDGCAKAEYEGKVVEIPSDTTIIAAGFKANNELSEQLKGKVELYTIGDCRTVANIKNAVWDAYEAARSI